MATRASSGSQVCRWCRKAVAEGDDYCSDRCHDKDRAYDEEAYS